MLAFRLALDSMMAARKHKDALQHEMRTNENFKATMKKSGVLHKDKEFSKTYNTFFTN